MTRIGDAAERAAVPVQIVLCHKGAAWAPGEESVGEQLEVLLVGDPKREPTGAIEWLDLASAIPLGDGLALFSYTTAPTASESAGALLDDALHSIVVALVDSRLLADPELLAWLDACARDLGTKSGRHRFLAIMRGDETKEKWQDLGDYPDLLRYQSIDFSQVGERAERLSWLGLRILHEILHVAAVGAGASPTWKPKIFVSHAKRGGLSLAKGLRDVIAEVPWLDSFYDALDIGNSCPWEKEIEEAVSSSILVALRTDQYDRRPFCQKEVLWAELYGVPVVLVEARQGLIHAASRLPFESAPTVRIADGNLDRILHAALRVSARAQLFGRWVKNLRDEERIALDSQVRVISVVPGMSTISAACESFADRETGRPVLCFPGPLRPGDQRAAAAIAKEAGVELQSPANSSRQLLTGLRVGVSVSESDDLTARGATPSSIHRFVASATRSLLANGADLAFGHDWRDGGVMSSLCRFVLGVRGGLRINPKTPAILSLLPWPDTAVLADEELASLSGILKIESVGLPDGLSELFARKVLSEESAIRSYLRARGLTYLRRQLAERSGARVLVGGRSTSFAGRYPGVFEEALLSLEARQPTYFLGFLGGVSELLGRAVLDKTPFPVEFGRTRSVPSDAHFLTLDGCYLKVAGGTADETIDLDGACSFLREFGRQTLSEINGLSVEENRRLVETRYEQEAIHLVLRGLRRLKSPQE